MKTLSLDLDCKKDVLFIMEKSQLVKDDMREWDERGVWLMMLLVCVVSLRSGRRCVSEGEPPAAWTGWRETTISEPGERIFQTGAEIRKPAGGHVFNEGNNFRARLIFGGLLNKFGLSFYCGKFVFIYLFSKLLYFGVQGGGLVSIRFHHHGNLCYMANLLLSRFYSGLEIKTQIRPISCE